MPTTASAHVADRLFTPGVARLIAVLEKRFGTRRLEVLHNGRSRSQALRAGELAPPGTGAPVRQAEWQVAPVPGPLLERRVELIGGCTRKELIEGMNAGAKSYVADLWNMTGSEPEAILRAHRNIERAAVLQLAYISDEGDRVRINPGSTTRLMLVPRPLHVVDTAWQGPASPVPASFVDLALHIRANAAGLVRRQGGVFLYLRGLRGGDEALLWADMFRFLEEQAGLAPGTIRATVMLDNLAAVLEADEMLHALRQHAAGLSLDPQAYAADHILLFGTPDGPVLPDREQIGLNAKFLRSASLRTISICHRRQVHAMGAPAFVLPPDESGTIRPGYLEMIADKEREAVDGHDGTLVGHPGLVNPAMAEFNKSMPRAHQMYYRPEDRSIPADLVERPEGELTPAGIRHCIRTVLRAMVLFKEQGMVVQDGRLHDRSSIGLSTLLLWHWAQNKACFITATGLEVHEGVMRYLILKEGGKVFTGEEAALRGEQAKLAAQRLVEAVLAPAPPPDLLEPEPTLAEKP